MASTRHNTSCSEVKINLKVNLPEWTKTGLISGLKKNCAGRARLQLLIKSLCFVTIGILYLMKLDDR